MSGTLGIVGCKSALEDGWVELDGRVKETLLPLVKGGMGDKRDAGLFLVPRCIPLQTA